MAALRLSILLFFAAVCMMTKAEYMCEKSEPQDHCELDCPNVCDPVCAVGKVEYRNQCFACCAYQRGESVEIAAFNECRPEDPDSSEERACTRQYDPYCGEDGRSFGNRCVYQNAAREYPCYMATQGQCASPTDESPETEENVGK